MASLLGIEAGTTVYEPGGCPACSGTGYRGRVGVFEAIRIDDTLRRLINDGGDEVAISKHAFANVDTLTAAARKLVVDGVTTPEEAVRISRRGSDDG